MKIFPCLFMLLVLGFAAHAEEHDEGHEAKKPPPVPSKGTPVGDVYHLPVVLKWGEWMQLHDSEIAIWGEFVDSVDGQKCSRMAVGQKMVGHTSVWKHFCVPQMGGDILVETKKTGSKEPPTYLPYDTWVNKCQPTDKSGGVC